jgi:hypothetical protein
MGTTHPSNALTAFSTWLDRQQVHKSRRELTTSKQALWSNLLDATAEMLASETLKYRFRNSVTCKGPEP